MVTLAFYNTREFIWINDQLKNLPEEMSEEDRKIFFCDFKLVRSSLTSDIFNVVTSINLNYSQIDMKLCAKNNVLGTRKFIIKLTDEDSLEFRRGLLTL